VTDIGDDLPAGGASPLEEPLTIARNVSTRYLAIAAEMVVGIGVLPFNIAHLGRSAYGLWMLTASITAYFSVLDLGYSGALVKFVAQYRAKQDARALNEILSTMFFLFVGFGLVAYLAAAALAVSLGRLFHLSPDQTDVGRIVLLVTSVNVACGIAFSVFGGVINGFQRYDLNNVVGAGSSIVAGVVNVAVLMAGYGLVALVVATTAVRVLTYWVYRANAYRVFPALQLRLGLVSRARLQEVTGFSIYMALIDWANKLNYSVDALVIGAFLNTGSVAVWSVGQRLAETTQRLTNQLNEVIFPAIVDHDTSRRLGRLQRILLVGTRLSLAAVLAVGGTLWLMADALVRAWVGPDFAGSVIIVRLLTLAVVVRVATSTAGTLLKAAGRHRLVACTNILTAVANLTLSMALVTRLELAGVALGTLVPVSLSAIFVTFPVGCRRVGVPVRAALARAVWPALWPLVVTWAYVEATRGLVGASLLAVAAEMAAAAAVYSATFLAFGATAGERRFCVDRVRRLATRSRLTARPLSEGV
jgi:O-antigen/teichoic acid export membrane protein